MTGNETLGYSENESGCSDCSFMKPWLAGSRTINSKNYFELFKDYAGESLNEVE